MVDEVVINGFCDKAFLPLKDAFEANFKDGLELGTSLSATHHGKPVVDLWAGSADRKRTRPWQEDTLVHVASSTKIPVIICALMAVDRGLLDLDEPVATYWPEFGAHGKEEITVREAFSHRALVPAFAQQQPFFTTLDWQKMVTLIADEAPWFGRGTVCYHALTLGFILGELMQRVTGRSFQEYYVNELAGPLGADFHIGLRSKADFARLAQIWYSHQNSSLDNDIAFRVRNSIGEPPFEMRLATENWDYMSVSVPGANGAGNARSLGKFGTLMAMGGELDGRRYLSAELVKEASTEQCRGVDPLFGDMSMGLGFGLDGSFFRSPTPTAFHWGGSGGSWCVMDTHSQTAFAYAMNHFADAVSEDAENMDQRQNRHWQAITEVCEQLERVSQ